MINILKAVMKNMDNIQGQMSHVSREMETLRTNQKETLETKPTATKMKNVSSGLVRSCKAAEERI